MAFCVYCGNKLKEGAKFCTHCGNEQPSSSSGTQHAPAAPLPYGQASPEAPFVQEAPKRGKGLLIALAALGGVLLIAAAVLLLPKVLGGLPISPAESQSSEASGFSSSTSEASPNSSQDPSGNTSSGPSVSDYQKAETALADFINKTLTPERGVYNVLQPRYYKDLQGLCYESVCSFDPSSSSLFWEDPKEVSEDAYLAGLSASNTSGIYSVLIRNIVGDPLPEALVISKSSNEAPLEIELYGPMPEGNASLLFAETASDLEKTELSLKTEDGASYLLIKTTSEDTGLSDTQTRKLGSLTADADAYEAPLLTLSSAYVSDATGFLNTYAPILHAAASEKPSAPEESSPSPITYELARRSTLLSSQTVYYDIPVFSGSDKTLPQINQNIESFFTSAMQPYIQGDTWDNYWFGIERIAVHEDFISVTGIFHVSINNSDAIITDRHSVSFSRKDASLLRLSDLTGLSAPEISSKLSAAFQEEYGGKNSDFVTYSYDPSNLEAIGYEEISSFTFDEWGDIHIEKAALEDNMVSSRLVSVTFGNLRSYASSPLLFYHEISRPSDIPSYMSWSYSPYPAAPFSVTVKVSDLRRRKTPSLSGEILGYSGKGDFTIAAVRDDWGLLSDLSAWIYLGSSSDVTIGASAAPPVPEKKAADSYYLVTYFHSVTGEDGKKGASLSFQRPVFEEKNEATSKMDDYFTELYEAFLSRLEQDILSEGGYVDHYLSEPSSDIFYHYNMHTSISYNAGYILSGKLGFDWYMGGVNDYGAGGFIFDTRTGETLSYEEITTYPTSYVQQRAASYLSALGMSEYESKLPDLSDVSYYLSESGEVTLYAGKYVLSAGAAGDFNIPLGFFIQDNTY